MCGFAGVIAWDNRFRTSDETLRKMSAAIAHRGPDGEGHYINHQSEITRDNPQVALAFRRLAILDPDPRSNQPFTDGRHWLVFNGEIYNFRELRKELESIDATYEWRTTGDTEVLLRAYAVWGEKCVEKFNGMFAFAVWDSVEKSLFLARDRMGQKPLYVAFDSVKPCHTRVTNNQSMIGGFVAIASEVSAFEGLSGRTATPDLADVVSYLKWGYCESTGRDFTIQLGRACSLKFPLPDPFPSKAPPFNPNPLLAPLDDATAVRMTREKVVTAVRRQMVTDVPLGCFLSGGIDSSVMAFAARQDGPLETFSIAFDDPLYDESAYAEAVAKHLGTKHHVFRVRPDAADDLPKLAAIFGEPFADSSVLPTHHLARETRQFVKVALSGDGGDELFGGYDRYRAMQLAGRFDWITAGVRRGAGHALATFIPGTHPKSRGDKLRRFLVSLGETPAQRYAGFLRLIGDQMLTQLLGAKIKKAMVTEEAVRNRVSMPGSDLISTFAAFARRDAVQSALATDRVEYLPKDLLTKVDRCSMMHGLEVRSPFMDHELVQFAAGLTTPQLLKGGPKRMLREAFAKDLPDFVFKRKKMGFAVPIGEWFRKELRPMLRESLFASNSFAREHFNMPVVERLIEEHELRRVDHSQRLYALLMLELWWQQQRI